VVAALGFFIIPAKRSRAKAEMRRKIEDVRTRLSDALRRQFAEQIARGTERLDDTVAPYSRFVRLETEKLRETEERLEDLSGQLAALRQRVDRLAA
jgi:predicted nuclease with TOPRIM domain